jgi:hypothetical protein
VTVANALRRFWPLALVLWLAWLLVPQDINLVDGGFILGQSHRVLLGEIPHADFISPRPAGTPILHTVDLLFPGPDFAFSRLIAIIQVVTYSTMLALFFQGGTRLTRVGVPGAAAIAASVVVNFHVFPAMVWHTIDGLFFSAIGFVLLERGLRERRHRFAVAGCLALGAAPLMKQSFALSPILGLIRLVASLAFERPPGWTRRLIASVVALALPGLAYVALVTVAGGFSNMREEISAAAPVYGKPLIDIFRTQEKTHLVEAMLLGGGLFAIAAAASRLPSRSRREPARWVALAARIGLTVLVLRLVLHNGFFFETPWSFKLFWLAVVVTVLNSLALRRPDFAGIVVCALGWMVTLSYGLAHPAFVGGSLAFYVLARGWDGARLPEVLASPRAQAALALLSVAAAAVVIGSFWDKRSDDVFLPRRPTSFLTAPLGGISGHLRGLKTDVSTAAYLSWVRRCVERYPAHWTAVVPEDAISGPAFGLHSPLPMDWLWPSEYPGNTRRRIVAAAVRTGKEGNYLMLFQGVTIAQLSAVPPQPLPAVPKGAEPQPFPFDQALGAEIVAALHGRRVACGPFVGIYEPRPL